GLVRSVAFLMGLAVCGLAMFRRVIRSLVLTYIQSFHNIIHIVYRKLTPCSSPIKKVHYHYRCTLLLFNKLFLLRSEQSISCIAEARNNITVFIEPFIESG